WLGEADRPEHVGAEDRAVVAGRVRIGCDPRDIPAGPHMLLAAHTTAVVDFDRPARRRPNIQGLQAQTVQPRLAAGGDNESFGNEPRTVVQDETSPFPVQLT